MLTSGIRVITLEYRVYIIGGPFLVGCDTMQGVCTALCLENICWLLSYPWAKRVSGMKICHCRGMERTIT